MKSFLFVLAVAGLAVAPIACSNPFAPDQSVILSVTKLDAPATIAVGSPIMVTLTVTTGGCVRFDHFEVERVASGASMTAWGQDVSIGRLDVGCTADIRSEVHSYTFDPPFQSSFTVQVPRGRVSPLVATVQVQ